MCNIFIICVTYKSFPYGLLLRMRRNTLNSTSGFKIDLKFGFLVPKNIYMREIRPSNCILGAFFAVFRYFVTAHAQKHH